MTAALFLDRDGVLNVDNGYVSEPGAVELVPGSSSAVREFNRAGIPVLVVSNQSGLARGYFEEHHLAEVTQEIARQLKRESEARIDGWMHCGYHPNFPSSYDVDRDSRKPEPGMLLQAQAKYGLRLADCALVGDKLSDIQAGNRVGCHTVLVRTGNGRRVESELRGETPWGRVADDLRAACPALLEFFRTA